jgi:hypothetical protein
MNLVLFIPGLISIYLVMRGRLETAFLNIFLPTLLLLPNSYEVRVPHLPPTTAAELVLLPIGIAATFRLIRSRSIVFMDVLVFGYLASIGITELLYEQVMNNGIFWTCDFFFSIVMAYAAGRMVIEPNLRLATVRRIVILILLLGPLGLYEWRFGQNLYGVIGERLLGLSDVQSTVQLRGGRGRMGGSFTDAEIGGIAFGMTAALNAWLYYRNKRRADSGRVDWLTKLQKYHVPGIFLLFYLWLTQSRGPEGATVAGYLVLQIPKFKNTKLMTWVVGVALLIGGIAGYIYINRSVAGVNPESGMTEQQGSTLYRVYMNQLYTPIAQEGGWLGWGLAGVPKLAGLVSIDNEFLRVWLVQGRLGILILLLIVGETVRTLVMRSWRFQNPEDRTFVFCMMAAMAVLWISLTTVYMGEQLPMYAFLLVGWAQGLAPTRTSEAPQAVTENHKFAFRRVFG